MHKKGTINKIPREGGWPVTLSHRTCGIFIRDILGCGENIRNAELRSRCDWLSCQCLTTLPLLTWPSGWLEPERFWGLTCSLHCLRTRSYFQSAGAKSQRQVFRVALACSLASWQVHQEVSRSAFFLQCRAQSRDHWSANEQRLDLQHIIQLLILLFLSKEKAIRAYLTWNIPLY